MSWDNSYTRDNDNQTGSKLDYLYHQKLYKFIGIVSARQANESIAQEINFVEKLDEDDGAAMLLIAEKQQKTILNIFVDPLNIME